MSEKTENDLMVSEAIKLLKQYSCIEIKTVDTEEEKDRLKKALLLITNLSEKENLGICASNSTEGFMALSSYLKALGYQPNLDSKSLPKIDTPIYIKYYTERMSYSMDSYQGSYRGVLISCQSENDEIVGTYGHFPIDLFVEE